MKKIIISLAIFVFAMKTHAQTTETFKWLTGIWKINTGQGYIVEQWDLVNDSTFSGRSFSVKPNNDTLPQESIQIVLRKGSWYYIPTVIGQNNSKPVTFKIQFVGRAEFISTNPDHDFPQRIAYRRIKNQLFASIEGMSKGKYVKQNFDFSLE
jgi:hypothetical protein